MRVFEFVDGQGFAAALDPRHHSKMESSLERTQLEGTKISSGPLAFSRLPLRQSSLDRRTREHLTPAEFEKLLRSPCINARALYQITASAESL